LTEVLAEENDNTKQYNH